MNKSLFSTRNITLIGLMAALSCLATIFLKVELVTPIGRMMFHFGDVFCLTAALTLGPLGGGLAGGIGMALSDLFTGYADSMLFTLVFKFIEGFLCGIVAYAGGKKGKCWWLNIIGAVTGTVAYIVLYITKSFVEGLLKRYTVGAALLDCAFKLPISTLKGVVTIVIALVLARVFREILEKSKLA